MTRGTTHVVVVGLDGRLGTRCAGYTGFMLAIVILIAILLLFGILGAVVKGLLWLTFIAAVLVVGAAAYGWWKFKRAGSH